MKTETIHRTLTKTTGPCLFCQARIKDKNTLVCESVAMN